MNLTWLSRLRSTNNTDSSQNALHQILRSTLLELGNSWANLFKTVHFMFTGIISESFTSLFSEAQDQYLRDLASQLPQAILKSKADNMVSKYLNAFNRWQIWAEGSREISVLPAKDI